MERKGNRKRLEWKISEDNEFELIIKKVEEKFLNIKYIY